MRYAWLIAKGQISPAAVDQMYGIDIRWTTATIAGSQQAAQQMVDFFGINGLGTAPALRFEITRLALQSTWPSPGKVR